MERNRAFALAVITLIIASGIAIYAMDISRLSPASAAHSTTSQPGGVSQYLSDSSSGSISINKSEALLREPLADASVSQTTNEITLTSNRVDIVAFALMPDNATRLTGLQPPTYSTDDVFVIGGLINPTLVIPKGATVNFTVINLDDDMYHDLVVSTASPPYPDMVMHSMMWGGSFLYMMPILSPADYASGWAPTYSYSVTIPNVSNLWYFCTFPGHAQSGMYGEIVTA